MAATATTPGRQIRRDTCLVHDVEWGQVYVVNTQTHESYWDPAYCPRCTEEFRVQKEWEEVKLPALVAEIKAETDAECEAEEGRAERIAEIAQTIATEDRAKRFEEWCKQQDEHFALQRADYLAYADSEDRARIDAEKIEGRRVKFFEEQKTVKAQADAELQKKLDADREQRAKESLGSWAMLG